MLTRTVFSRLTLTRNATAPFMSGSSATSSIVDGSGSVSPSSTMPRICNAKAPPAMRRASSSVLPAVTHPGKSGKLTPKSDLRSLCRYAMYSMVLSPLRPGSTQFDPGLFLYALESAYRDVSLRMGHRDAAFFRRVFELFVAAGLIGFVPAIPFQFLDD